MRRHSLAFIFGFALIFGASESAHAAAKGDTCELGEALTLSARPNGKGKKRNAKAGDTAKVLKVNKKGMVRVKAGRVKGWVSGEAFDLACGAGEDETMAVARADDDMGDDDFMEPADPVGDEASGDGMGMEDSVDSTDSEFGAGSDSMSDSSESTSDFDSPSDSSSDSGAFGSSSPETSDDFSSTPADDDFSSASSSEADDTLISVGLGAGWGTEVEIAARGELLVNLGTFVPNLRIDVNFLFYLAPPVEGSGDNVSISAYELNFDVHYTALTLDDLGIYALVGFSIFDSTTTVDATELTPELVTGFSANLLNLGAGVDWGGLGFADVFLEAKYSLELSSSLDLPEGIEGEADPADQFVVSAGLRLDVF